MVESTLKTVNLKLTLKKDNIDVPVDNDLFIHAVSYFKNFEKIAKKFGITLNIDSTNAGEIKINMEKFQADTLMRFESVSSDELAITKMSILVIGKIIQMAKDEITKDN